MVLYAVLCVHLRYSLDAWPLIARRPRFHQCYLLNAQSLMARRPEDSACVQFVPGKVPLVEPGRLAINRCSTTCSHETALRCKSALGNVRSIVCSHETARVVNGTYVVQQFFPELQSVSPDFFLSVFGKDPPQPSPKYTRPDPESSRKCVSTSYETANQFFFHWSK